MCARLGGLCDAGCIHSVSGVLFYIPAAHNYPPSAADSLESGRCVRTGESHTRTHAHTHPFNGRFSRTTRVGRYQKGKTNLDFTEARDSEWQWHQLGICNSAPRSRQITTPAPHHSVFYRPVALPAAQPTVSKH